MRAPQYGLTPYKASKRGRQTLRCAGRNRKRRTPTVRTTGLGVIVPLTKGCTIMVRPGKLRARVLPAGKPWRAVGLRGPNQPLPLRPIHYLKPRDVQYDNGTFGAACTLSLWHKSAIKGGVKDSKRAGPTVTKRYAVVEKRPRH